MPAVRCTCTGNAIITFFMPFDPAPWTRNVAQNTRPFFRFSGEGFGDETRQGEPGIFSHMSMMQLEGTGIFRKRR